MGLSFYFALSWGVHQAQDVEIALRAKKIKTTLQDYLQANLWYTTHNMDACVN